MPKRKRDTADGVHTGHSTNARPGHGKQSSEVEKKLFHGKKVLHRAIKIAKRFERQKLARREKSAREKGVDAEISRISAEILALKELDLGLAAENHIFKSLLKDKAAANSSLLPDFVKSTRKGGQDVPTTNVTARLYNSQPVKEALEDSLPPIRKALGVDSEHNVSKKGRGEQRKGENDRLDTSRSTEDDPLEPSEDQSMAEDEEGILDTPRYNQPLDAEENGEAMDEDYAELDSRIASGSEDGSEDELEIAPQANGTTRKPPGYVPEVDLSLSPSSSEPESPPPVTKGNKTRKETNPPSSSTFLPSLTMGGYYSGSDSASEPEDNIEQLAPRKNRRGQRARQKIWEQKYGGGAKHLQKNPAGKSKNTRDAGWDMKRGAQMEGNGQRKPQNQPRWKQERLQRFNDTQTNANSANFSADRSKGKKADQQAEKPLHPSWEAARKAKEKSQQGTSFSGTKVVFD